MHFLQYIQLITFLGGTLGFLCHLLLSLSSRLWHFYAAGALISFVVPIVSSLLGVSAVTPWFSSNRSFAVSLVLTGTSLGTVLYSQAAIHVLNAFGWRSAYFALGVLLFIITAVSSLLISPPPEALDMTPYGWGGCGNDTSLLHGMSLREARYIPGFRISAAAAALGSTYVTGLQQSLVPMYQTDYGLTAVFSAPLLSIFSLVCTISKPLMGILYGKAGIVVSVSYVGLLTACSILILYLSHSAAAAVVSMAILGLGNMFGTVILTNFIADSFGNREYSSILGFIHIFFTIGVSFGPVLVGRIVDLTHSDRPAYGVFLVFSLTAAGVTLLANRTSNGPI